MNRDRPEESVSSPEGRSLGTLFIPRHLRTGLTLMPAGDNAPIPDGCVACIRKGLQKERVDPNLPSSPQQNTTLSLQRIYR
jgi:hypothetical protein